MTPSKALTTGVWAFRNAHKSPTMATWLAFGVRAISFVALYPFVLRSYQPPEIAFWLATAIPGSMLGIIDAGLTPTFIRFFSYAISANTRSAAGEALSDVAFSNMAAVVGTSRRLYAFMAGICAVFMSVIAVWIGRNNLQSGATVLIWVVVVFSATFYFWSLQFQSWLQANNRIPELRMREVRIQLGALIISTGLAMAHQPIFLLPAVSSAALSLLVLLHRRSVRKGQFGEFWRQRPVADRGIATQAIDASWKAGVGVLMSYGLNQGVCAWYAASASPIASTSFLLTMRLLQVMSQVAVAPFSTKVPELAARYSAGKLDLMVEVAVKAIRRTMWVFLGCALGISFLAPLLMNLIHSKSHLMPPLWVAVAIIGMAVERGGAVLVQVFTASNVVHWHWLNSVAAIIALLAGYCLWGTIGDFAIPLSWLLGMSLFYAPAGFALCVRLLDMPRARLLVRAESVPFALVIASQLASWLLL